MSFGFGMPGLGCSLADVVNIIEWNPHRISIPRAEQLSNQGSNMDVWESKGSKMVRIIVQKKLLPCLPCDREVDLPTTTTTTTTTIRQSNHIYSSTELIFLFLLTHSR
jgi:hypothetical protein